MFKIHKSLLLKKRLYVIIMFGVPKFTVSRNDDIISNGYLHITLPRPISYHYKEDSVIILQRLWRWKKNT